MKILQINKYFYKRGGSEVYFFQLSDLERSHGHQVVHFSMQDNRNEPSPQSEYFVKRIDFKENKDDFFQNLTRLPRFFYSFEVAKKLTALLKAERPDVAHIHNFSHHLTSSLLRVLKKYHIPVVVTLHDYQLISPNALLFDGKFPCEHRAFFGFGCVFHGCIHHSHCASLLFFLESAFHRFLDLSLPFLKGVFRLFSAEGLKRTDSKYIDAAVAPSHFLAEKYRSFRFQPKIHEVVHFTQLRSERNVGTPQGTDLLSQDAEPSPGDEIMYIGRLSEEKGVKILLETARRLPATKFAIVGNGPMESLLKAQATENVTFCGELSYEDTQLRLAQARLIVVPSLWYENCPLVILEAMAFCKTVVASRIGGIPELISDGKTGFLFPPGDVEALSGLLWKIASDDVLLREIGRNAAEAAKKRFSPEKHYKAILQVYEEIMTKH
jgi:glycosyltransferase involved in cell wall biosynthesis